MERLDPLAVYGKPWPALDRHQQTELMGYEMLRLAEEASPAKPGTLV